MRQSVEMAVVIAAVAALAGCDNIMDLDNYDAPDSILTGRVAYQDVPVGVRNGTVELELWEPAFDLNEKVPVHVHQDGTFTATLFDGTYKLNSRPGNGPWVARPDTVTFELRGEHFIEFEVVPYYLVEDETVTYNAAGGGPHGSVDAGFRVRKIEGGREVEYVGLYIGTTRFVDRDHSINVSDELRERRRTAIAEQLDQEQPILISVPLPENIYETQSPVRRDHVFARIGIKIVGVEEMLFAPLVKVDI